MSETVSHNSVVREGAVNRIGKYKRFISSCGAGVTNVHLSYSVLCLTMAFMLRTLYFHTITLNKSEKR